MLFYLIWVCRFQGDYHLFERVFLFLTMIFLILIICNFWIVWEILWSLKNQIKLLSRGWFWFHRQSPNTQGRKWADFTWKWQQEWSKWSWGIFWSEKRLERPISQVEKLDCWGKELHPRWVSKLTKYCYSKLSQKSKGLSVHWAGMWFKILLQYRKYRSTHIFFIRNKKLYKLNLRNNFKARQPQAKKYCASN